MKRRRNGQFDFADPKPPTGAVDRIQPAVSAPPQMEGRVRNLYDRFDEQRFEALVQEAISTYEALPASERGVVPTRAKLIAMAAGDQRCALCAQLAPRLLEYIHSGRPDAHKVLYGMVYVSERRRVASHLTLSKPKAHPERSMRELAPGFFEAA